MFITNIRCGSVLIHVILLVPGINILLVLVLMIALAVFIFILLLLVVFNLIISIFTNGSQVGALLGNLLQSLALLGLLPGQLRLLIHGLVHTEPERVCGSRGQ